MNRRAFLATGLAASSYGMLRGADLNPSLVARNAVLPALQAPLLQPQKMVPGSVPLSADSKLFKSELTGSQVELFSGHNVSPKTPDLTECVIVQVSNDQAGTVLKDPFNVDPTITGSDDKPDVALSIQLQGFHMGESTPIDSNTRATMRVVTTNQTSASDNNLQPLYWAVMAGIDLWKQYGKPEDKKASVENQQNNIKDALVNRPIEVRNGLASIQIQILQHKEPPWWRQIFSWLVSPDGGEAIAEALGYGAIAKPAMSILDKFVTDLGNYEAKPIIQTSFGPYAFSKRGRNKYETGFNVCGHLNGGSWILLKPEDFDKVAKLKPYFYGPFGRLIPAGKTPIQFSSEIKANKQSDALSDVTYAVFTADTKEFKFDVS